jgi:hypothetical protein
MRLVKFTPVATGGSALAYLDIEVGSGLVLRECQLMRGPNGAFWIAMPSQKVIDRDGNPILDQRGKPRYRNFIDFRDRANRDRFADAALDLIRREHPDVFDGVAP